LDGISSPTVGAGADDDGKVFIAALSTGAAGTDATASSVIAG
jgi:hypothetical protein